MEKRIEIVVTTDEKGSSMNKKYQNLTAYEIIGILEGELVLAKLRYVEEAKKCEEKNQEKIEKIEP